MLKYTFCPQCKTKTDESGEYPKCPKCNITFYKNSKPTSGVLPIKNGKVLLAVRGEEPFKGTLDIIGGFLKAGEHPIDGVHRELMEETGMKVKIIDLLGIYTDFYAATGDHTQNTFYIGKLLAGKPKIMDDIADLKWLKIDEIDKHDSEIGFQCIKDALKDLQKWYKTSRIAETTLELYDFIINNLETVDKFNEDMNLYLQGKMAFQQQQYMNIML